MTISVNVVESLYLVLIFAGYLILWSYKRLNQRKETGIDPEVIYQDTRASQQFFSILIKIMSLSMVAIIVLNGLGVDSYPGLIKFEALSASWINHLGLMISISGLLICYIAQKTMGSSWRVGIDSQNRSDLITHGIYKFVRNPTYAGLYILCFGVFVIAPMFLLLTWILLFYFMMEFQVRLEEEHLLKTHKEEYKSYLSSSKRYLPFIY